VIHLDTSVLIRALVRDSSWDRCLRQWLEAGERVEISAIAWTEFLCGPLDSAGLALAARIVPDPVPFVEADGTLAAELFNLGGRRRSSLLDCMIAAVALRAGASLATANPSDFRRCEAAGLHLVGP
jgi:predicted nucleic acid-binding protein